MVSSFRANRKERTSVSGRTAVQPLGGNTKQELGLDKLYSKTSQNVTGNSELVNVCPQTCLPWRTSSLYALFMTEDHGSQSKLCDSRKAKPATACPSVLTTRLGVK